MGNKKAITPIIAVVLLVLMTVGVAASVMVWLQNFMGSATEGLEENQIKNVVFDVDVHYVNKTADGNLTVMFKVVNTGSEIIDVDDFDLILEKKSSGSTTYKTIYGGRFNDLCSNTTNCGTEGRLASEQSCFFYCTIANTTTGGISFGDEFRFKFSYKNSPVVTEVLRITEQ